MRPSSPEDTTLQLPRRGRITARRAPPADPAGPLLLGRYRLIERLGAGGFGVVWRAQDEQLGREVALKRVPAEAGENGRAEREALAAARLAHPAIVALHEAGLADGEMVLISELVVGSTLAELIAEDALEDEEIAAIGLAIAGALEHAHERGVIHRDVKPQNILVPDEPAGPQGAAKLVDFGGASLVGEEALTRTGDVLGTLAYMAPEQLDGEEADERSDLYSLALVLFEAFSGENPMRGQTPAATVRRIGGRAPRLATRRRGLPRELTDAIDRALLADPAARGDLAVLRGALAAASAPQYRVRRLAPRRAEHDSPTAEQAQAASAGPSSQQPRIAVPGALAATAALVPAAWLALTGRPGAAVVLLAAAFPLFMLPGPRGRIDVRRGLALGAPALGLLALAGSWPALAGQFVRWRERLIAGALGFWLLSLCGPLVARQLWFAAAPAPAGWQQSLHAALTGVLAPAFTARVAAGCAVWALAALALPLLLRGRSALADVLLALGWGFALAAATLRLQAALGPAGSQPHGLIVGTALGAGFAVAVRALRGPV